MPIQVLFPNSGLWSKFSGFGGYSSDGTNLETLPTIGENSLSSYVQDGTISPTRNNFWTFNNLDSETPVHYEVTFDAFLLGVPSTIKLRIYYNTIGYSGLPILHYQDFDTPTNEDIDIFTWPDGVDFAYVECWGGGGGGNGTGSPSAGGGAYSAASISRNGNITDNVFVGRGGDGAVSGPFEGNSANSTYFRDISTVYAIAGQGSTGGSIGGLASNCVGDVKFNGGNGGNSYQDIDADEYVSGGAGGAGGPDGDGLNGTDASFGTPGIGGSGNAGFGGVSGNGADGVMYINDGLDGYFAGGGGGTSAGNLEEITGGRGGDGKVRVNWTTLSDILPTLGRHNIYFKKNNNPSILDDFLVGIYNGAFNIPLNSSGIAELEFTNVRDNFVLYPTNGYMSVSGTIGGSSDISITETGLINLVDYDLYIDGAYFLTSQTPPLFISGSASILNSINSGITLFTKAFDINSGNIPLYMKSFTTQSGNCDFFTNGLTTTNNNFTLFTYGNSSTSGSIPLYTNASIANNGNCDLFTNGFTTYNDNVPLYTVSVGTLNNTTNLYIFNSLTNNSGLTLYEYGIDTGSGVIPLYLNCVNIINSGVPLYTLGPITLSSGVMNLYTLGPNSHSSSGNFSFFIWSATNSGLFSNIPLSLGYTTVTPDPNYALDLYLQGPRNAVTLSSMNLFLNQDTNISKNFDLFLSNNYIANSGNINFVIFTQSGTDGAIPIYNNIPLYIARNSEGIDTRLSLFTKSDGINDTVNLYMSGANPSNNFINLFSSGQDIKTKNLTFYLNGF